MLPSIKQPTRVELLICLDIAFSLRRQRPEDLSCECKRGQTICCDNTSITDCWRRPIELFTTILRDILPDEVLAVARMQTLVEQATMSESQSRSTNRRNRSAQSDHGPHNFGDLGHFSVGPGLTAGENENIC